MLDPVVSQRTLLKEYIKTLIASDVVFPGVLPRQWGKEFDKSELDAIYFGLKSVVNTADPDVEKVLIEEFSRVEQADNYMHWFLCNFWREIVGLLAIDATPVDRNRIPSR